MKLPAWLESVSPGHLAVFLARGASPRKSGLFIRHLCRCFPDVFSDPRSLAALNAADAHEAGDLTEPEFSAAWQAAVLEGEDLTYAVRLAGDIAADGFFPNVMAQFRRAVLEHAGKGFNPRRNPTARAMRPVFFEHFGDPRSPVERDPSWLTSTVVKLAEGMYASRDFAAMPILADALMDAGCDNADVLDHCRADGPHVRGCWVVDLVLGKS